MSLPQFLQPYLWSVDITELDLKKDRVYVIGQILAFGNIKALIWLFKTYSLREIKQVFIKHSMKIYRSASFNFVKNILLDIVKTLPINKYVANSPRHFR